MRDERVGEHADRGYAERLATAEVLLAPINRAAVAALELPRGSKGLDAGCGIGLQSLLLAEAVGEAGRVVGVDLQPGLLAEARVRAEAAGMSRRVSFEQGNVQRLPFAAGEFDWAWSANCVGYGIADPEAAVAELARVVQPGGLVALLVWSSQLLLPGYPLLEARLNATGPGLAPFTPGAPPEWHHLRGLGLLRAAGLHQAQALTFVGQAFAPLAPPVREGLADLLQMRWPGAQSALSSQDAAEFRRLCQPESSDFILDHPDYYALYTETLFRGRVGKPERHGRASRSS
ncbi:MAG TPA: methyltransferase domain-containing protein [Acidimicrobiia bacterium]|nr:methyltransferase domain-containing protein [Acidimicrobiia bacterium]